MKTLVHKRRETDPNVVDSRVVRFATAEKSSPFPDRFTNWFLAALAARVRDKDWDAALESALKALDADQDPVPDRMRQ